MPSSVLTKDEMKMVRVTNKKIDKFYIYRLHSPCSIMELF